MRDRSLAPTLDSGSRALGPTTTDRRCRWNTDERQWRRQSTAKVLSSVGFWTHSTTMQAQCPSGNTSQYCVSSLREGPRNERPRQSQALDITKALERASLVPGLQHFHKLGLPATFPPTECQMAAASYLCVRPWNGIGAARDPGPFLDASCGDRGLVRSPVPSLNSLSMGPGIVNCHLPPARGQGGIKWPWMGNHDPLGAFSIASMPSTTTFRAPGSHPS